MNIEYEEFESVEEVFMYLASVAPPMKNTMSVNSYKGYVMSMIPLGPMGGDTYLMIYTKGNLDAGIYEYDITMGSYKRVATVERADKTYFIAVTPKRNTIADAAIEKMD